jgi:hypothetical protein
MCCVECSWCGVVSFVFRKRPDGANIMALQPRLPSRFPVGTRYILEGEPGIGGKLRIVSRYVVMPNGRRYDLMTPAERARKRRARIERRAG